MEEDSVFADVISSIIDGDGTTVPFVAGGDVNMAPFVEEDVASTTDDANLDVNGGNDDVLSCDSSPISLDLTAGSFTLANYSGGRSSSPVSLEITTGSFALANYFEGYDFSPMSLDLTARSFALGNYSKAVALRFSLLASLDLIVRSFDLANCFGG
ncbi:hypothetical protein J1N35_011074 [Gossypium stocksii]|uniref:Uncharacterized protein n=1 Tax=Gossypium stocksii TaxID=47602 RepID=A0A9D3W1K4_9ROSI|nr:hypothetical protein J1N35_011074 [Gossypium stocksii]